MANWVDTSYHITGNAKDMEDLYELIRSFIDGKREPMEKDADKSWEGNIVLALGESVENKYIRGFIRYVDFDGEVLTLDADEAWQVTDFEEILRSHYKDMEILYMGEEWGDEYFITNDKDKKVYSNRFAVNTVIDGDSDYECHETEEYALHYVAYRLDRKSITRDEVNKWNEEHEDDDENSISICKFKVVD